MNPVLLFALYNLALCILVLLAVAKAYQAGAQAAHCDWRQWLRRGRLGAAPDRRRSAGNTKRQGDAQ